MADRDLRRLERRFRETGSPADEAAYLRERLRRGSLDRDRLAIAAWLGHQPARELAPQPSLVPPSLIERVVGLGRWGGPHLVVRAVSLAVADAVTGAELSPQDAQALDACAQWVADPATVPAELLQRTACGAAATCAGGIGPVLSLVQATGRLQAVSVVLLREVLGVDVDPTRSVSRACAAAAWSAWCAGNEDPVERGLGPREPLREAVEWALEAATALAPDEAPATRAVVRGIVRWALEDAS